MNFTSACHPPTPSSCSNLRHLASVKMEAFTQVTACQKIMALDQNLQSIISTALQVGDFDTALPLLEAFSYDQISVLTLPDQCTPLHYACQHGRVDVAQRLITNCQCSIESKDVQGCTPLHTAAQYGQVETLTYLLQRLFDHEVSGLTVKLTHGGKLSHTLTSMFQKKLSDRHRDQSGNTPLHTACVYGQLSVVQLFSYAIGTDTILTNRDNLSYLHLAALHGHLPLVRYQVEEVGRDVTLEDEHGRSPTYLAAGGGHLDILKYLIEGKGADPNFKTSKEWKTAKFAMAPGRSLVHTASREGHLHVVRYLVEHCGCDPSCHDDEGITPLHLTCLEGHIDIVSYLITEARCDPNCTYEGRTPLQYASYKGHLDVVRYLVDICHCDPLHRDESMRTPMHRATIGGHLDVVRYFVTTDLSNLFIETNLGNAPLHVAALAGHLEVAKFLIEEMKCDPNLKGQHERTPLHHASEKGHLDVVTYLVESLNCDPLCPDESLCTPLDRAIISGQLEVVCYFMTIVQNIPFDTKIGGTAVLPYMHLAALHGRLKVVKFLIKDMKCKPNSSDSHKKTPLHYASERGHLDVVKYLVDVCHCDPLCQDELLHTPAHWATIGGHLDVVRYFVATDPNILLIKTKFGSAPLHLAAFNGCLEVVKFLIEDMKCDPNLEGQFERTPLHHASENGHLDVVRYLVNTHHCDPLCPDQSLHTPLQRVIISGQLEVVCYFMTTVQNILNKIKIGNLPPYLHLAALHGRLQVVKFLIEDMKYNPNSGDSHKKTPLHYASERGHLDVVKYLVDVCHCDALCRDESLHTPMHRATIGGHLDVVRYFVVTDPNILLFKTNLGNTPLHLAALNGHLEMVKFLIEDMKCDPNLKGQHDKTPLHHASEKGRLDVVAYLVESHNCNPMCPDEMLHTPLHRAIISGQLDVVCYFITTVQNILIETKLGDIPLYVHLAALHGHLEVVKFLIEDKKCNPNSSDSHEKTPLHYACERGHLDVVKYLVDSCHCDSLCRDESLHIPMHRATIGGHLNVVHYFVTTDSDNLFIETNLGNAPLHLAALYGHLEVVKFLIEDTKCDPNIKGQFERIPLHHASERGHLDVVKYLVGACGCNPLKKDQNKYTPLHEASAKGQFEVVRYYLMMLKCDPSPKDEHNNSPLHYAAQNGHLEVVSFLIENMKCDPLSTGNTKKTLLHFASESGHLEIMMYLVDCHHCDPLQRDEVKQTPLHRAAANGHMQVVRYLTRNRSCDPLIRDAYNNAPLHYAARTGHLDVVKFFIVNVECSGTSMGQHRRTPLHFACESGNLEIVKYLVENHHCDPLCLDEEKQHPLHRAAANGHIEVMWYLALSRECDCSSRDVYGNAPLHYASHNGHLEVVKFLIGDMKCSCMSKGRHQRISLHQASVGGHLDVVEYLVKECGCDPFFVDQHKRTSLHLACLEGNLNVARYLESAMDRRKISIRDQYSRTPLHCASVRGHLEIVKFFIEHLNYAPIPLAFATPAVKKYLQDVTAPYFSADENTSDLHCAALNGDLKVVQFLIEQRKCDPNCKDQHHKVTPLHRACENGHTYVVEYLMCLPKCDGQTALHVAASNGWLEIVECLVETYKCSFLARNPHGNTPLHLAVFYNHLEVVKYFIEKQGCDPNIKGEYDCTPLHLSLKCNYIELSKYFIANPRCDILTKYSGHFSTAVDCVHLVVKTGSMEIIQFLCNHRRLDSYLQTEKGRLFEATSDDDIVRYLNNYTDPLHHAAGRGDVERVSYFVERKKWNPNELDRHGNNTLHHAAKHGRLEVVKYLTGLNKDPTTGDIEILCDPLTKNKSGLTAQLLASQKGHRRLVRYFLRTAINQPMLHEDVLSPYLNIFVVGNSGSGKSTLVKALTALSTPLLSRFVKVKDVTPLTTGIQSRNFYSEVFGNAQIYDFAGHEEYYASHEMVLQQTIQPLVLLTLDISLHQHVIKKQLLYWFAILSNISSFDTDVVQCIHLVVIGSHVDQVNQRQKNEIDKLVALLASTSSSFRYHGFYPCDCRYSTSENLSNLLRKLKSISKQMQLIFFQHQDENTNQSCAFLKHYLNGLREMPVTMTITELWQLVKGTKYLESYLPNQDALIKICKTLSLNRHLMFLLQEDNIGQSLLVLKERDVLSRLHSCLPEFEKEGSHLGTLDEAQLQQILSGNLGNTMEPELATRYLLLTQFCTKISADHLTDHIPSSISNSSYYFFPNLVHVSRPDNLLHQGKYDYTDLFTWILKCSNAFQFFTPRFLPALFIQITKFNEDAANSEFTIWKNGILFIHSNGTRSIVEVTDQITRLCFSIQCVEGCESQMVKHRSMLISLIRSLLDKTCPAVKVEEFLLLPDSTYPPDSTTEIPLSKLAYSVINGSATVAFKSHGDASPQHVFIKQLLNFDSLHAIEDCVLRELICHSQCTVVAPCHTLCTVYSALKGLNELAKLLEDRADDRGIKELTYSQLYQILIKFSIFTSENLYALTGESIFQCANRCNSLTELLSVSYLDPLSISDLSLVNEYLIDVTYPMKFGRALGVKQTTLDRIKSHYFLPHQVDRCFTEVLAVWLRGEDRPLHSADPNWEEVITALKSLHMKDLLSELVQKLSCPCGSVKDSTESFESAELDHGSLGEIVENLQELNHKWFHLGLSLGLRYSTLKNIEASPLHYDVVDHMTDIILKWLKGTDLVITKGPPSWTTLAHALNSPLVKENQVARKILKDYTHLK